MLQHDHAIQKRLIYTLPCSRIVWSFSGSIHVCLNFCGSRLSLLRAMLNITFILRSPPWIVTLSLSGRFRDRIEPLSSCRFTVYCPARYDTFSSSAISLKDKLRDAK